MNVLYKRKKEVRWKFMAKGDEGQEKQDRILAC